MKSKRVYLCNLSLIILCTTIFSGCTVVFQTPLPRSLQTRQDPRLSGKWMGQNEEGTRAFIRFDRSLNGETNVSLFGEKSDTAYLGYQNPIFRMLTARMENRDYMILRYARASTDEGYQVATYAIKDGKLTIWILSVDKVREAFRKGELKGDVGGGIGTGLIITDPAQAMTLLKDKELFVRLGEFERAPNK